MRTCESCGAQGYRLESKFCLKCGSVLGALKEPNQNICTNQECDWNKTKFIYPDDSRFCDVCGSATVYGL